MGGSLGCLELSWTGIKRGVWGLVGELLGDALVGAPVKLVVFDLLHCYLTFFSSLIVFVMGLCTLLQESNHGGDSI